MWPIFTCLCLPYTRTAGRWEEVSAGDSSKTHSRCCPQEILLGNQVMVGLLWHIYPVWEEKGKKKIQWHTSVTLSSLLNLARVSVYTLKRTFKTSVCTLQHCWRIHIHVLTWWALNSYMANSLVTTNHLLLHVLPRSMLFWRYPERIEGSLAFICRKINMWDTQISYRKKLLYNNTDTLVQAKVL